MQDVLQRSMIDDLEIHARAGEMDLASRTLSGRVIRGYQPDASRLDLRTGHPHFCSAIECARPIMASAGENLGVASRRHRTISVEANVRLVAYIALATLEPSPMGSSHGAGWSE